MIAICTVCCAAKREAAAASADLRLVDSACVRRDLLALAVALLGVRLLPASATQHVTAVLSATHFAKGPRSSCSLRLPDEQCACSRVFLRSWRAPTATGHAGPIRAERALRDCARLTAGEAVGGAASVRIRPSAATARRRGSRCRRERHGDERRFRCASRTGRQRMTCQHARPRMWRRQRRSSWRRRRWKRSRALWLRGSRVCWSLGRGRARWRSRRRWVMASTRR